MAMEATDAVEESVSVLELLSRKTPCLKRSPPEVQKAPRDGGISRELYDSDAGPELRTRSTGCPVPCTVYAGHRSGPVDRNGAAVAHGC